MTRRLSIKKDTSFNLPLISTSDSVLIFIGISGGKSTPSIAEYNYLKTAGSLNNIENTLALCSLFALSALSIMEVIFFHNKSPAPVYSANKLTSNLDFNLRKKTDTLIWREHANFSASQAIFTQVK